jgi:ubiquinone/menaquinone biosynthesis C-methylase UbiE
MNSESQHKLVKEEFTRAQSYASEYHGVNSKSHFFNTRLQRVSELLSEYNSGRVLDIGCGPATIVNMFRNKPIEYHGVDISKEMIKVCTDTFKNDQKFRFSLGNIEELPFHDSCFDAVLCLGAFEYVVDGYVAVNEIVRVLKPKGIVIITMLNGMSPYRLWQRFVYFKLWNIINKLVWIINGIRNGQKRKKSKHTIYRETAFRHLLTSGGLMIEDILYYDFNLFFSPLDSLFPAASVFISSKLEFLCRSKLKSLGTGFILRCRKN